MIDLFSPDCTWVWSSHAETLRYCRNHIAWNYTEEILDWSQSPHWKEYCWFIVHGLDWLGDTSKSHRSNYSLVHVISTIKSRRSAPQLGTGRGLALNFELKGGLFLGFDVFWGVWYAVQYGIRVRMVHARLCLPDCRCVFIPCWDILVWFVDWVYGGFVRGLIVLYTAHTYLTHHAVGSFWIKQYYPIQNPRVVYWTSWTTQPFYSPRSTSL